MTSNNTKFTMEIRNLRALRHVVWAPDRGIIGLIGASGSGKTTLLQALRFLRVAYDAGVNEAAEVFGGRCSLRSWGARDDEPVIFRLSRGQVAWELRLHAEHDGGARILAETLTVGQRVVFARSPHRDITTQAGLLVPQDDQLALREGVNRGMLDIAFHDIARSIERIFVYAEPDLWTLRNQGSRYIHATFADPRGVNALAVLRAWRMALEHKHRYTYVVDGLRAAYGVELALDDESNAVVAHVKRANAPTTTALAAEPIGLTQLLVLLCQVAGAPDGSIVAIDAPETHLHAWAICRFIDRVGAWARHHDLCVLLPTNSPQIISEMGQEHHDIYEMKPERPGGPVPTNLTTRYNPGWLAHFALGDLYIHGEIGGAADPEETTTK